MPETQGKRRVEISGATLYAGVQGFEESAISMCGLFEHNDSDAAVSSNSPWVLRAS